MQLQRYFLLLWLTASFSTTIYAQTFTNVDAYARSVDAPKNNDVDALAQTLTKNCTTETEKVRSFYVWLADNIKYDVKTFENRGEIDQDRALELQTSEIVLKRSKAVCQGYAQLMDDLCKSVGIKSFLVGGRTKSSQGKIQRATHAWNVVQVDGQWACLDATYGSGNVNIDEGKYVKDFKEKFFCTAPEVMITTHYPEDPLFQLLPTPITFDEFKKLGTDVAPLLAKKQASSQSLKDTLQAYYVMDSLVRYQNAGIRIMQLEPTSNYGIYSLTSYHLKQSMKDLDRFVAAFASFPQSKSPAQTAWIASQSGIIQEIERNLDQSKTLLQLSSQTDQYTPRILQLRSSVKQLEGVVKKNKATLERMKN